MANDDRTEALARREEAHSATAVGDVLRLDAEERLSAGVRCGPLALTFPKWMATVIDILTLVSMTRLSIPRAAGHAPGKDTMRQYARALFARNSTAEGMAE
jgi:hypothetical protein